MKTTKLVVGILQIVMSLFILLQSCAVGLGHAMENNTKDSGGSIGVFAAILFLASGITYIATRKSEKLGGDIAGLVMMAITWVMAITNAHDYKDLQVWGWLALVIGLGFFCWHFMVLRKANKQ